MNVLIVLNSFEDDGPGRVVLGMARHWVRDDGVALRAVALSRGGALEREWRALGIETEVVQARGLLGVGRLRAWARRVYATRAARPHVVHTHLLWPDLAMRWVMPELGEPVLLSTCHGLHALDEKGPLAGTIYRWLEATSRWQVDGWVAVSRAVARDLAQWGVAPRQIHTIHNGIEAVQFPPIVPDERGMARTQLGLGQPAFVIGAAGNLRPVKGHDVLLRGFARFARGNPQARLVVAGDGPERPRLEELAARLGITGRVHWLCQVKDTRVLLAALDLFVQPSRAESFGLAVAEAQCRGLAAVVTRVGGLPEVVKHNETGLVVESGKPAALARALEQLALDADQRRRLGQAGARRVRERFDIADSARRYVALWRTLVVRQTSSLPEL